MQRKRMTKSNDRWFLGVLGGIADYFNIDPTIVRIVYAALSILTIGFPGITLYIILALVMPGAPRDNSQTQSYERKDVTHSNDTDNNDDDWSDF